jgi:hypothetical protein
MFFFVGLILGSDPKLDAELEPNSDDFSGPDPDPRTHFADLKISCDQVLDPPSYYAV